MRVNCRKPPRASPYDTIQPYPWPDGYRRTPVRSAREHTAVREQDLAGEVTAFIARQEQRCIRNVERLAEAAQRDARNEALNALLVGAHACRHWRFDEARPDGVHAHLVASNLEREHLREHPDASLRNAVLGGARDRDL